MQLYDYKSLHNYISIIEAFCPIFLFYPQNLFHSLFTLDNISNNINKDLINPMSAGLAQLMQKFNNSMTSNNKIGSTTTVNEQVDEMEATLYTFKRLYETQQKQQTELQFQLKKFQQQTKTNFMQMNKQLTDRIDYLTNLFKQNNQNQNNQFQHMEYQNKVLHEQHDKLHEIGANTSSRTQVLENSIGITN